MEENKRVSIIVPVYNAGAYIEETIRTVREQTYADWELLLVEDGSGDDSLIRMESFTDERIRIIRQPANMGAAKARNRGLSEASGRYIAFLDADDLWDRKKLEKQMEYLKSKSAAFLFTSYEYADAAGVGSGKVAHVPEMLGYKAALRNTIIFTSTVLFDTVKIPKELLEMPLVKSEDTAAWWKILKNGYTAYGMDEVLVRYRRPAQSLSSNKLEAVRRVWNLYRRVEGLSLWDSVFNFCCYAVNTTRRRL